MFWRLKCYILLSDTKVFLISGSSILFLISLSPLIDPILYFTRCQRLLIQLSKFHWLANSDVYNLNIFSWRACRRKNLHTMIKKEVQ